MVSYKWTLTVTVFFIATGCLSAQKVRQLSSTRRDWSGGIAGRHGSNFTFSIEFSGFKKEPVPDTIWIGQEPIPILFAHSENLQTNTKRTAHKRSVIFDINVGTSSDESEWRNPRPGGEPRLPQPHAPVSYNGVALLSYSYKGKRRYFTVAAIMNTYPPVNYP